MSEENIFEDNEYAKRIHNGVQDAIKAFSSGDPLAFDTYSQVETVMNSSIDYRDIKSEIEDLREVIVHLDNCYHVSGEECINPITSDIVTDNEYDAFKKRIEQIDPAWDGLDGVIAADEEIVGKKVAHDPPMTSISKCNGTQEEKEALLLKWINNSLENISYKVKGIVPGTLTFIHAEKSNKLSVSYKHDGIAVSINYKNGKLLNAALRSKSGVDGIDVTAKIKNVKNVPTKLPLPLTLTIRGEIETYVGTFEKVNETLSEADKKSNPRAYTAGTMNRKTAAEMKGMGLVFVAYNIVNFDDAPYKTEIERATWVKETLGINYVKTILFSFAHLGAFETVHRQLPFMVDGAVVSVNNLEEQVGLGTHGNRASGNPKGKIAWKFADEVKEAIVTSIEWQIGRTGTATPVLNFKGIQLEGTTVSKCTAHNLGIIEKNKIGVGSRVAIIKSGKIIPKIKSVIEAKGKVEYPDVCPCCGEPTKRVDGNNGALSLVCDNSLCTAQQVQNLDHYLKRIGVKGIAEKNIEKLTKAGLVSKPADFYKLTIDGIKAIGIKERSATLIVARVKMVVAPEQEKDNSVLISLINKIKDKKIPIKMETFIASLGIDGSGREFGRIMAENYDNLDDVRKLSKEELGSHRGIGITTASSVYNYFKDNANQVDELLKFVKIEIVKKKSGNLDGKNFVLSGSLDGGKTKWKTLIEDNGGTVKSSLSSKIHFLIAGEGSVGKTQKAEKLNIPILDVEKLEKMLSS